MQSEDLQDQYDQIMDITKDMIFGLLDDNNIEYDACDERCWDILSIFVQSTSPDDHHHEIRPIGAPECSISICISKEWGCVIYLYVFGRSWGPDFLRDWYSSNEYNYYKKVCDYDNLVNILSYFYRIDSVSIKG